MQIRPGHIAVVTGGGDGIGRKLCVHLAERGVDVALCDISAERMEEALAECRAAQAAAGVSSRLLSYVCDVSVESQCLAFRDEVKASLGATHLNFSFNNAGVGCSESVIDGDRKVWDYCSAVCWGGVYNMCRAFMAMLVASAEGCLVNMSSLHGIWASLPDSSNTAYAAAKFAVRGFTEALINDFRKNAPHLRAVVVFPGFIATSIVENSTMAGRRARGENPVLSKKERKYLATFRETTWNIRHSLSADDAALITLNAVEDGRWRCLVGDDAEAMDAGVRKVPDQAYDMDFEQLLKLGNPEWHPGLRTQLSRRSSGPTSSRL